mgnify:CR=1 FL=1
MTMTTIQYLFNVAAEAMDQPDDSRQRNKQQKEEREES